MGLCMLLGAGVISLLAPTAAMAAAPTNSEWHGVQTSNNWHGVQTGTRWHGAHWHSVETGTRWHGVQTGNHWHGTHWHSVKWHGVQVKPDGFKMH